MPVPTLVTDLSTTLASNSPAGSDNVFPDLDNYLRALSGFVASIRDNSGNGWVSPYLPLAGGTVTGATIFSSTVALNGALSGTGLTTYLASPAAIGGTTPAAGSFTTLSASGNVTLSGGTANGVLYLNGSKVATSGAALAFNGTSLLVGKNSSDANNWGVQNYATNAFGSGMQLTYGGVGSAGVWVPAASSLAFGADAGSGTTELMRLTSTGLGIGTSSPAQKLHISTASATSAVRLTRTGTFPGDFTVQAGGYGTPSFLIYDNTAAAERLLIDGSGNVGIGTSSPGAKLDVRSAIGTSVDASQNINAIDTTAYALGNGGGVSFGYVFNSGGSVIARAAVIKGIKENATDGNYATALTFSTTANSASTTEKMRLDSSGNLGLGVTPSAWNTSAKASQIGSTTALWNFSNGLYLSNNRVFDSVGNKYIANGFATTYEQSSGQHIWLTAPSGTAGNAISFTQAMTLDASGNLLVNRTAVVGSEKLSVNGGARLETFADIIGGAGTPELRLYQNTNNWSVRNSAGALAFYDLTGSAERARITSGGESLVGTTVNLGATNDRLQVNQTTGSARAAYFKNITSGADTLALWNADTSANNIFAQFYTEATATARGSITYNRAGGLVAYNTTSDYRAKDIIGPVQNPGATIDALKVYEGVMKGATQSRPMLIAHEAQAHAPYAVSGVKDEVNEDGTPKFQQIDVSSLVPLLLAEIQSLRARVAALEA